MRKLIIGIWLLLFFGMNACLKPDPTSVSENNGESIPVDQELRAGSSSSTNWPPKTADIPIQISVETNPRFIIHFSILGLETQDTGNVPKKISGSVTLYLGGVIPALETVPTKSFSFVNSDSVEISNQLIESLSQTQGDTIYFNLNLKTDSLAAWEFGFGYIRSKKIFFKTEHSILNDYSASTAQSINSFKGVIDNTKILPPPTIKGTSLLCFYIPGTHYFWKVTSDTLSLGPLPEGKYPLRLLRLTNALENEMNAEIEIYSVSCVRLNTNSALLQFIPTDLLSKTQIHRQLHFKLNSQP